MAHIQSAVSDLFEAFRSGEGVDLVRESVRIVLQEVIESEASAVIGATPSISVSVPRVNTRPSHAATTGPSVSFTRSHPSPPRTANTGTPPSLIPSARRFVNRAALSRAVPPSLGSLTLQNRPKRASRIEHHEVGSGMHGKSELSLHRALIVGPSTDM